VAESYWSPDKIVGLIYKNFPAIGFEQTLNFDNTKHNSEHPFQIAKRPFQMAKRPFQIAKHPFRMAKHPSQIAKHPFQMAKRPFHCAEHDGEKQEKYLLSYAIIMRSFSSCANVFKLRT
jgi:hypothetical protein